MAVGRRSVHPVPDFQHLFKQGKEEDMRRAGKLLEDYLLSMAHASYNGLPAPHGDTHISADPLPSEATEEAELMGWLAFQRADE
jgi:hypothetical protein